MKSNISWKGMIVVFGALILFIGTYRFAMSDISFPHIFQSGDPAVAQEVNDNFAAINTRQTATFSTMAGNFRLSESIIVTERSDINGTSIELPCVLTVNGNLLLNTDGTASFSGTQRSLCAGTVNDSVSLSGTYAVNADGSGTFYISGNSPVIFQVSKDLNTMVWDFSKKEGSSFINITGVALRL